MSQLSGRCSKRHRFKPIRGNVSCLLGLKGWRLGTAGASVIANNLVVQQTTWAPLGPLLFV